MSKLLKVLVAIILGFLAAITAFAFLAGRESQLTQRQQLRKVYVAARDINRGTLLTTRELATRNIPVAYIQPAALSDPAEIVDKVARTEILKGEQILGTKLSSFGDETLSSLVLPEHRAVTIPVTPVSSVAGLVKPGDIVDVLGVFQVTQGGEVFTEVKLVEPALTIVAVDQNMQPGGVAAEGQGGGASFVTFVASPEVAQRIVLAQHLGPLTLLLRRAGDASPLSLGIYDSRLLLTNRQLWSESIDVGTPPPAGRR